jgi:hypothetical protein
MNKVADIRTTPVLLFIQPPRFYLYNPHFLIRTIPWLLCICIPSGQQPRRRTHNTLTVAPYSTGRVGLSYETWNLSSKPVLDFEMWN